MSWSGGTYTKGNNATGGWVGDASLGIGIEAGRHDTQDNDFAAGINQCLNKDGSNSATGNLNIGTNRVTNIGAATARTDAAQVAQVQDGDYIWLGTTGGTATAMTANATPAITSYKNGQKFRMKPGFDSTGSTYTAHTLAINGIAPAATIIHPDGQSPTRGSWQTGTGRVLELTYNDGFFVVTSTPEYYQAWTPTLTVPAGAASSINFLLARFIRLGNAVSFQVCVTWTQSTASAAYVDITLPVNSGFNNQIFSCAVAASANLIAGWAFTVNASTVRCYSFDQQQILTGSKQLHLSGTYNIGA